MNARIDPKSIGSTGFDVIGQWSDPTPSTVARAKNFSKQGAAVPSRALKNQHYVDWDDHIDYPSKSLIDRVTKLEKKIKELTEPEETEIREISLAQAKKEIRQYFKQHHGDNITAADLEENLRIEFELALEVCESLEKEGKIKGV